jgi:hypothetical protein
VGKNQPPKKPTHPFGTMNFSKDGSIKPAFARLPDFKEPQELEAIRRFIEQFNAANPAAPLSLVSRLAEADQDFLVSQAGNNIEVQLTELVDRTFLRPLTADEYNKGHWTRAVVKNRGEAPWRLDIDAWNQAMTDLVAKKAEKHYSTAPSVPLWLVIFTTFPYETEAMQQGQLRRSEGLCRARRYLAGLKTEPFAEVWFFHLPHKPVKVWPCTPDGMVSTPEPAPPPGRKVKSVMVLAGALEVRRWGEGEGAPGQPSPKSS